MAHAGCLLLGKHIAQAVGIVHDVVGIEPRARDAVQPVGQVYEVELIVRVCLQQFLDTLLQSLQIPGIVAQLRVTAGIVLLAAVLREGVQQS